MTFQPIITHLHIKGGIHCCQWNEEKSHRCNEYPGINVDDYSIPHEWVAMIIYWNFICLILGQCVIIRKSRYIHIPLHNPSITKSIPNSYLSKQGCGACHSSLKSVLRVSWVEVCPASWGLIKPSGRLLKVCVNTLYMNTIIPLLQLNDKIIIYYWLAE